MKYIFLLILLSACGNRDIRNDVKKKDSVYVRDTVFMPELPPIIDTVYLIVQDNDSIRILKDTINARTKRLNISEYKLQKIDYYVKIVDSKPSQITFLKGWVKRALRE